MPEIHPLSFVDPKAEIADDVEVGPFSYVGAGVRLGPGTRLLHHVSIVGRTTVGARNTFYPFCSIGAEPQDVSYRGEDTRTVIGDGNTFRECVTVHRATMKERQVTSIGSRGLFMACCHIAHDCIVEDDVILANGVLLGGHVHVESCAVFGGASVVHHFATIGRLAFVGGMTRVARDVPPYMVYEGNPPKVWMVNKVGCARRGIPPASIEQLKRAHRLLFRTDMTWEEAFGELLAHPECCDEVRYLVDFLRRTGGGVRGRAREAMRASWGRPEGGVAGSSVPLEEEQGAGD